MQVSGSNPIVRMGGRADLPLGDQIGNICCNSVQLSAESDFKAVFANAPGHNLVGLPAASIVKARDSKPVDDVFDLTLVLADVAKRSKRRLTRP